MAALVRSSPLLQRAVQRVRRALRPASLGALRRTLPYSNVHGFDRGTPVDRYYIERFLSRYRHEIRGYVLELQDSSYTNRFGTDVVRADVLDIAPSNPAATIVADLTAADPIPADRFDCFILTQTLHLIYDVPAALRHARRILKPDGVLQATVPAVGRVPNAGDGTAYWRFTADSCVKLFGEVFGPANVTVAAHGNVLACVAHLMGMAYEELSPAELELNDQRFPLVVTVRAVKRPE
jgi:SAM-dependent methyltransferase